jgi:uncharacterized membrane protein YphA (DoxX/SURF4 family)
MLSSIFFVGPVTTLMNSSGAAKKAEPVTEPIVGALQRAGVPIRHDPEMLVRVNAGVQLAAATALATGRCPRLAASVLAVSLVPTTLAGHAFWRESDPAERRRQQVELAKNASLLGGLLIAALDTEGRPGKAWMARAAAKRLGHEAEHLATTAKLEGRIAQLQAAGAGDVLASTVTAAASGLAARSHDVAGAVNDHVNHDTMTQLLDKAEDVASTAGAGVVGAVTGVATSKTATKARKKAQKKARSAAKSAAAHLSDTSGALADALSERSEEWHKQARSQAKATSKRARKAAKRSQEKAEKRLAAWTAKTQKAAERGRGRAQHLAEQGREQAQVLAAQGREQAQVLPAQGRDRAQELAAQGRDRAQELAAQGRDRAQELASQGRERAQELAAQGRDRAQELNDQVTARLG